MDKTSIKNITLKDITDKETYNYVIKKLKELKIDKKQATTEQISEICFEWAEMTFKRDTSIISKRVKKRLNQINTDEVKKKVEEIYKTSVNPELKDVMPKNTFKSVLAKQIFYKYLWIETQYIHALMLDIDDTTHTLKDKNLISLFKAISEKSFEMFSNDSLEFLLMPNTLPIKEFENFGEMARKPKGNSSRPYGFEGIMEYSEKLSNTKGIKAKAKVEIDNGRKIAIQTQERQGGINLIEISNEFTGILSGGNESTCKILCYIFSKALNYYDKSNGSLSNNTIKFKFQELVDIKIFARSDKQSRTAVEQSLDSVVGRKIKVKYKKVGGKGGSKNITEATVIFTKYTISNGVVTVDLNDKVECWDFLFEQYTTLPKWTFSLKITAFRLLRYTYYLARQNKTTISFNSLINELNLSYDTKYKQRTVFEPIEKAIEEIEDKQKELNIQGVKYTLPTFNTVTEEFLENNTISFELPAEEQKRFNEIKRNKVKKIEQIEKSKLRATGKKQK
ncbi:MAG: hypothetical protein UIM53_05300 [Acutalibacteraceae bacterium]|nr:hypothetical protein [Acutalibacteraceae bacterium]